MQNPWFLIDIWQIIFIRRRRESFAPGFMRLRAPSGRVILLVNSCQTAIPEGTSLDKNTIKDVREQLVTAQDALLQAHSTIESADANTKDAFGYTKQVNMTTFQIQILGTVKTLQDMIKTIDGLLAE